MSGLLSYRHVLCLALLVATLASCSQEAPQYPDQALLLCNSASDCPSDWECLPCPEGTEGCETDQSICAPVFDNVCGTADEPGACCGNGTREAWEACDDGNTQDGDYCASDCSAITTVCGDGLTQGSEVCDDGSNNSDAWSFAGQRNATCSGRSGFCGDGRVEGDEVCDEGENNAEGYFDGGSAKCATTAQATPIPTCTTAFDRIAAMATAPMMKCVMQGRKM